jgi:membrane-associated phospholipid phosphatase
VRVRRWIEQADRLDVALYAAVARAHTPTLDRFFRRVSRAANYAGIWLGAAALLAVAGGAKGRRAALDALMAIAVTSIIVNAALKPLGRRRRPDVVARGVPIARHVRMPVSHSFPSGHSASAFAFASGVAATQPAAAVPLRVLATLVSYSRVHTGVHYPGDVLAGALLGVTLARVTTWARRRRRS